MRPTRHLTARTLAAALLTGLVVPSTAFSYCKDESHADADWKDNIIVGTYSAIPVYANWSHGTVGLDNLTFEYASSGFDQDAFEVYLKAAIDQVNDAATGARIPPFYFDGWLTDNTASSTHRPARSVVVHAASDPCGGGAIACATVDGTVAAPAARCAAAHSARAATAALSGSACAAKRRFATVYSCPQNTRVSSGSALT